MSAALRETLRCRMRRSAHRLYANQRCSFHMKYFDRDTFNRRADLTTDHHRDWPYCMSYRLTLSLHHFSGIGVGYGPLGMGRSESRAA